MMIYLRRDKSIWYDDNTKKLYVNGSEDGKDGFLEKLAIAYSSGKISSHIVMPTTRLLTRVFIDSEKKDFHNI